MRLPKRYVVVDLSTSAHLVLQEASMKKERATMSDEQRERQLISEQIERAAAEAPKSQSPPPGIEEGLKRDEGAEKVVLSLAPKTTTPPAAPSSSAPALGLKIGVKPGVNPLKANPLKANPLKKTNVFKAGGAASSSTAEVDKKRPLSAAEQLILEDQERKRRRMDRDNH